MYLPHSSARPTPHATRRERYRVLAVEMAAQHAGETVWRLRVRSVERMEPTYLLYVGRPTGRPAPHDVGTVLTLDERLLEREG